MAEISRYVLVDRDDNEGDHEFEQYQEAVDAAGDDHAVIERTYKYLHSWLVRTPNGGSAWPPKQVGNDQRGGETTDQDTDRGVERDETLTWHAATPDGLPLCGDATIPYGLTYNSSRTTCQRCVVQLELTGRRRVIWPM